jgi:hypothetical protein
MQKWLQKFLGITQLLEDSEQRNSAQKIALNNLSIQIDACRRSNSEMRSFIVDKFSEYKATIIDAVVGYFEIRKA